MSQGLSQKKRMIPDVDVFISNYTIVDPEVYKMWVDGCTAEEAVEVVLKNAFKNADCTLELVRSDVFDHYRTYNLLEKLLHNPPKLAEQLQFQIEPLTRQLLIEQYYAFDDNVIREILGKKLSARYRKDLDEVSDKTGVCLKSCRRQFDNVKRIFKAVEDLQGSVIQNIKNLFLLPEELAKRYGAVVFMACLKFETNKRKLLYLTFDDFYECASSIMHHWTYPSGSWDHDDIDLDREFLLELREIRCLMDKEKELKHSLQPQTALVANITNHREAMQKIQSVWARQLFSLINSDSLVCSRVRSQLLDKAYQELEFNFRTYSRSLITIGCNLHRNRDLKDLFIDLVEKCIEPWKQVNWTQNDLKTFLAAYRLGGLQLDMLRDADAKQAWERYTTVLTCCLLRMYHS